MDTRWNKSAWRPTFAGLGCQSYLPKKVDVQKFADESTLQSRFLNTWPYNPQFWCNRGMCMVRLDYPELGLGDGYKALLLVEAIQGKSSRLDHNLSLDLSSSSEASNTQRNLGKIALVSFQPRPIPAALYNEYGSFKSALKARLRILQWCIYTTLIDSLYLMAAKPDIIAICNEALVYFPNEQKFQNKLAIARREMQAEEAAGPANGENNEYWRMRLLKGVILTRPYPWMGKKFRTRSESTMKATRADFATVCHNAMIQASNVDGMLEEKESNTDCFGVFATRDIKQGECILVDRTVVGVSSDPEACAICCYPVSQYSPFGVKFGMRYCSRLCAKTASQSFSKVLCKKDLSFLTGPASMVTSKLALELKTLLLLRVLAISIQEKAEHPLHSSVIGRLMTEYNSNAETYLDFENQTRQPLRILRLLDVNIFTNHRYDSWVLQTIMSRLQTNIWGSECVYFSPGQAKLKTTYTASINLRYTFFNHSCEPSVSHLNEEGRSELTMVAERAIKKGEELFITYVNPTGSYKERRGWLAGWFAGGCHCAKCIRDGALEESDSSDDEEGEGDYLKDVVIKGKDQDIQREISTAQ